jgi:hypothetical protein
MNEGYTGLIAALRLLRLAPGALALTGAAWLVSVSAASAQWLPSHPVTWLGGRLVVSGDASVSMSTSDHDTYFNYGDYDYDMMRLVRLGLAATLRLGTRVTVGVEVRGEGATEEWDWRVYPVTSFIQVRPFGRSSVAVAAGIVPPAFGAFMQRRYGADNLLVGYPLAYQYTTAVRADAIPATADEVIHNRARGWAPRYTIGAPRGVSGIPLVSSTGWDPGLMVSAGRGLARLTVAVTRGGMAAPGSASWGGRWEVTARGEFRPTPGLIVGVSGAHGAFLADSLTPIVETAVANRDPRESAFGADLEYSRGYWLVRAETIVSSRTYPAFRSPYTTDPLNTVAVEAEARYRILPGLYAAARIGHVSFGWIEGSSVTTSWDADVTRFETGLGYSLTRNVLMKAVYQYNTRESERRPTLHLGAGQLVVKF